MAILISELSRSNGVVTGRIPGFPPAPHRQLDHGDSQVSRGRCGGVLRRRLVRRPPPPVLLPAVVRGGASWLGIQGPGEARRLAHHDASQMFTWRVAALVPWPVAAGVCFMGASTVAGGFYALFLLPRGG
jgi:hypothetical protein